MTRHFNAVEVCFICGRESDMRGVGKGSKWGCYCESCGLELALRAYKMTDSRWTAAEMRAIGRVSNVMGQHLEQFGERVQLDITPAEWQIFVVAAIKAWHESVRKEVDNAALAPASEKAA